MRTALLGFDGLTGWADDDHAAAKAAFFVTADLLGPDWAAAVADAGDDARGFFERHFTPVLIGEPPALITGYYEPVLPGSLTATERFDHPLYARPPDLPQDRPWLSRAEIEDSGALAGRELVWLENAAEAFFAQVQGSVCIEPEGGETLRFGFAGKNGHPYRSIGAELVRRGEFSESTISADAIRLWLATHPDRAPALLRHNPSFVFFERVDLAAGQGPRGAMGRSVTPMRTIAADPVFVPQGAPVWVETRGAEPIRGLMIAQDTGSAIKGAQRADIFFGSGVGAGHCASAMKAEGRLIALLPNDLARRIAS